MAVRNKHTSQPLFPSWKRLLLSAADRLERDHKKAEAMVVRGLLESDPPDYLEAAKRARTGLGAVWFSYLREQIDLLSDDVEATSLALPQAVWRLGSQLIITTNYDKVLRWASPQSNDVAEWDIEAAAEQSHLISQQLRRPTVWHLHGKIDNAARLILTPNSFKRLYPDDEIESKFPAALQTLRTCLASHSFLFIGFSLDDEHFGTQLKAIEDVYQGANGPHYAVVREAQKSSFKQAHPSIEVVTFPDFGEPLVNLVNALGDIVSKTKTDALHIPDTPPSSPSETIGVVAPTTQYSLDNPVFFVPFREKGDQVIGREEALERVRKQLTERRQTNIGQAASFHGLGGLGKTQLAVEYAYRYREQYPGGVIWIQDIESQLTKLSDEAKWLAPSSEPKQKQDAARHRIRSRSDCLLIFDNLERLDSIEPYLPELQANPHILVTSRLEFPEFPSVPLDPLDEDNAYLMLTQEAGRKPETESAERAARNIAQALDGLPLALEIAGAYLRRPASDWEKYYNLLQQNPRAVLKSKFLSSFTKHEADLYATLKISDVVFEEEPLLRDIVDLLTWSGSAPMNLSLMCAALGVKHEAELTTALDLGASLRLLVKSPKKDGYALHRLVSQVRREEVPLANLQSPVSDICQFIGDWFQSIREEFNQLAAYEGQLDHLRAWQQNATQVDETHTSRLLWLQAFPAYHRGRHSEIKALVEKALQIFSGSNCEDRGLEAHLHNDLGFASGQSGDERKAMEYVERALAIRLQEYGEQHPDTATEAPHQDVG